MKDYLGNDLFFPEKAMTPGQRQTLVNRKYRTRPGARASALPGPVGETCKSCTHACGIRHNAKVYYKCEIARTKATNGPGTDIRLKDPACSRWEKE